mmetsp:Transcript_21680/g.73707  ORF Transcript_21680/g.73707 Transcript_21680/m.73707 type:complete len:381 (+) Transcript_21680:1357-2499(+)
MGGVGREEHEREDPGAGDRHEGEALRGYVRHPSGVIRVHGGGRVVRRRGACRRVRPPDGGRQGEDGLLPADPQAVASRDNHDHARRVRHPDRDVHAVLRHPLHRRAHGRRGRHPAVARQQPGALHAAPWHSGRIPGAGSRQDGALRRGPAERVQRVRCDVLPLCQHLPPRTPQVLHQDHREAHRYQGAGQGLALRPRPPTPHRHEPAADLQHREEASDPRVWVPHHLPFCGRHPDRARPEEGARDNDAQEALVDGGVPDARAGGQGAGGGEDEQDRREHAEEVVVLRGGDAEGPRGVGAGHQGGGQGLLQERKEEEGGPVRRGREGPQLFRGHGAPPRQREEHRLRLPRGHDTSRLGGRGEDELLAPQRAACPAPPPEAP